MDIIQCLERERPAARKNGLEKLPEEYKDLPIHLDHKTSDIYALMFRRGISVYKFLEWDDFEGWYPVTIGAGE